MYSRRQFLSKIALGGTATFLALKSDALARVKEAVKTIDPEDSPEALAKNEHF
jgi:hypothetical protein